VGLVGEPAAGEEFVLKVVPDQFPDRFLAFAVGVQGAEQALERGRATELEQRLGQPHHPRPPGAVAVQPELGGDPADLVPAILFRRRGDGRVERDQHPVPRLFQLGLGDARRAAFAGLAVAVAGRVEVFDDVNLRARDRGIDPLVELSVAVGQVGQ
jgi:hypothetical protein